MSFEIFLSEIQKFKITNNLIFYPNPKRATAHIHETLGINLDLVKFCLLFHLSSSIQVWCCLCCPSVLQLLMIHFVVFIFSFVNFVLTLALTKKIRTLLILSFCLAYYATLDGHQAWGRTCNFVVLLFMLDQIVQHWKWLVFRYARNT